MITRHRLFSLLLAPLVLVLAFGATAETPSFETLLTEAAMQFEAPAGFEEVAAQSAGNFPFDRALRGTEKGLEVRYAIRPIARMQIDYQDPHSSAPEPNHIFPLVFDALLGRISAGGHNPSREYSLKLAREVFNADWATAAAFDVDPSISHDYRYGFIIAQHKNNKADAYTLFLYNDPGHAKQVINRLAGNLRFLPDAATE